MERTGRKVPDAMRPEDAGTCELELLPRFKLRLPPRAGDGRPCQEDRPFCHVGPGDDFSMPLRMSAISVPGSDRMDNLLKVHS